MGAIVVGSPRDTNVGAWMPTSTFPRVLHHPRRFFCPRQDRLIEEQASRRCLLAAACARENQLVGRRKVKARLEPEQGRNAADDFTSDRHRVPAGSGEAV